MSKISIVIPCYHNNLKNYANTTKCLNHIKKTSLPYELILVENIERWLASEGDIYLASSAPKTFAENVNTGLKLATGGYIVVLNNDVFVPEGWLEALMECFKIPDCGIATLESSQFGRPCKDEIIEMFFGGIFCLKREVVERVGLFDESFRHAFDDADYWVRTYKEGYKFYMNRKVMVEHNAGSTIFELNGSKHNDIYVDNRVRFNEKHKGCGLKIFEVLK